MNRLLLVALIGCGRLDFDPTGDARTGDAATAIEPLAIEPARFSTTSPTFVEIPGASLTLPPSPGITWLVLVSGALQSSSFAEIGVEARYLIDGIERGLGGTQAIVTDRPGPSAWRRRGSKPIAST
ncbi:MAG: hypothetical protein H0T42_09790 [Deltaproteobacteria bacterium]|nr:hypothetical protein [Deltaproteobacteria bacterium]